ncbi:MAG TPA: efflux RND transporter periplasmic adaptor subunit [Polyangia bacterium]|jgi:cobalt-zinc-cadmium efflux system membrane fusion protein|nr:efflux RND transporter periplasmic adaptor subunit [Polyangia bacterium]
MSVSDTTLSSLPSDPSDVAPRITAGLTMSEPGPPSRSPWPRSTRWLLGAVVVLGAGGAIAALLPHSKHAPAPPPPTLQADRAGVTLTPDAPQWKYVELAVAQEAAPLTPLPAPGRIAFDPKRTASVGAPLAGRVEAVTVRNGDRVKLGAPLFSVRSGALADLDREVQAARETVGVKKRLLDRVRDLFAVQAVPEKEVLAAEAELKEAELSLKAAVAKTESLGVETAGTNLYWMRAPREGTVVELDVYESQEVTPDRDRPLLRIALLDEVLALADVQEADAADLRVGAPVIVQGGSATERSARIEHISEVIDPQRRTVEVRIRVPNQDRSLRPNAFVQIAFQPDPPSNGARRIRVPAQAVVSDGNQSVVFAMKSPGRLERVPVVPGRRRDGEVEIKSGLEPGTRYVSRGALLLLNQVDLAD